MSVKITIRGVREEVRDELAARAAAQGLSLQKFMLAELKRIAERPSLKKALERLRQQGNFGDEAPERQDPPRA